MPSSTSPSRGSRAYWDDAFAEAEFLFGHEPGPVARRAEKYHRAHHRPQPSALDIGCGEGQDLAFLAERGYDATGLDFSQAGLRKSRSLLEERGLAAQVLEADLSLWQPLQAWDLVLCVNVLGFAGERADFALHQALRAVAPGGVLGLSTWAREDAASPALQDGVRLWTRDEIFSAMDAVATWQKLEVAVLWQYFRREGGSPCEEARPFVTVVAQKLA